MIVVVVILGVGVWYYTDLAYVDVDLKVMTVCVVCSLIWMRKLLLYVDPKNGKKVYRLMLIGMFCSFCVGLLFEIIIPKYF